jgi:hypothetical protein
MTAKLRLGPIPKTKTIKPMIAVSSQLKADLDRYCELHTQTWGEKVDPLTLIPLMLEQFILRDRVFSKTRKDSRRAGLDKPSA